MYLPTAHPRTDPPVRPDGRCAVCKKERTEIAARHGDPFCSTGCAKKWHRTEDRGGE